MDWLTWREIDRLLIIPSVLPSTGCALLLSCHYPFSFPLASLFPYSPPNRPDLSIFGNIHGILPTSSPFSVICLAGCHCGLPLYGASWHSTARCTWPATLVQHLLHHDLPGHHTNQSVFTTIPFPLFLEPIEGPIWCF